MNQTTEPTTEDRSPAAKLLLAWAEALFQKEKGHVRRRAARIRDGRVEAFDLESLLQTGPEGLVQAAAVLSRTVADHDLVAVFGPGKVQDKRQGAHRRTGFAPGATAMVVARSRDGELVALSLRREDVGGGKVATTRVPLPEQALTRLGDWTDSLFVVDPALDAHLLARGFPGARAPSPPKVDPLSLVAPQEAPTLGPRRPEAVMASAAARAARAQAVAEANAVPPYPWAAARAISADMDDCLPGELGDEPIAEPPAADPLGIHKRPFAELVAHGWANDAQACRVVRRIAHEKEPGRALAAALASPMPAIAKAHACAWAALAGRRRPNSDFHRDAGAELVARVDAEMAAFGGEGAWLDAVWPREPRPGDEIGTVSIANAATAAFWRFSFAWSAAMPKPEPIHLDGAVLATLARMAGLRDRLLDRLAPPDDLPGRRIVEASRALFPSLPSDDGEPDLGRFWAEVRKRSGAQTAAKAIPAAATLHAAVLHGVVVITETLLAGRAAHGTADPSSYAPERVPVAGLLARARLVLARHCVQCAMHPPEERSLARLAHAARLMPGEPAFQACFNEARFRAGRHDEALLADLLAEANRDTGLAAAAEALTIAEAEERPREVKVARKRMTRLAERTPHAWIANVRATFRRRDLLVDAARLEKLEAGRAPDELDPAERVVLALYGPDPAARVAMFRNALPEQRKAIEERAAHAEERAQKKAAGPAGVGLRRPEVPTRPSDAAVMRAFAAIKFRLDLPKIATARGRRVVNEHVRRAAELTTLEDVSAIGPWLAALDAGGSDPGRAGLVPALDALVAEDDATQGASARVEAAAAAAERALDEVLAASWASRFEASLRPMWATVAQLVDAAEPAKEMTALLERGARARDAADRERADADRRAFIDRMEAAAAARWASDAEAATNDEPVLQRFKRMVVSDAVLARSRRELGTPEWAIESGQHQMHLYNLAEGRRDQKALHVFTADGRPLHELRHRGELPVRVVFLLSPDGPRVLAVMVKHDDAEQNRLLERIAGWAS